MLTIKEIQELGFEILLEYEETNMAPCSSNTIWKMMEVYLVLQYKNYIINKSRIGYDGYITINHDGSIKDMDSFTLNRIQEDIKDWYPTILKESKTAINILDKIQK